MRQKSVHAESSSERARATPLGPSLSWGQRGAGASVSGRPRSKTLTLRTCPTDVSQLRVRLQRRSGWQVSLVRRSVASPPSFHLSQTRCGAWLRRRHAGGQILDRTPGIRTVQKRATHKLKRGHLLLKRVERVPRAGLLSGGGRWRSAPLSGKVREKLLAGLKCCSFGAGRALRVHSEQHRPSCLL